MNLDDRLRDKTSSHGQYEDTAAWAQAAKMLLRRGKNWDSLPAESKEALENVATLLARILTGDAAEAQHWDRCAGYFRLRAMALTPPIEASITRLTQRLRSSAAWTPPADGDGVA